MRVDVAENSLILSIRCMITVMRSRIIFFFQTCNKFDNELGNLAEWDRGGEIHEICVVVDYTGGMTPLPTRGSAHFTLV